MNEEFGLDSKVVSEVTNSRSASSESIILRSVVEENFSPVPELVLSLVEVASLVQPASPLDQRSVLLYLLLLGPKVGVVELLLPPLAIVVTVRERIVRLE